MGFMALEVNSMPTPFPTDFRYTPVDSTPCQQAFINIPIKQL